MYACNTKQICEIAHACGISVEAELGSLAAGAASHEGSADDVEVYTSPDAAEENPHLSVVALNQMQYVSEVIQKYMSIFANGQA